MTELEILAAKIPHMGGGLMGPFLQKLAREATSGTAIVELGAWLGAATAHLAIGMRQRGSMDVSLHVYDNFSTSKSSAEKANRQGYEHVREGDDTLPLVQSTLAPFGVEIDWHKGMLTSATEWGGKPISVYSDDASKYGHTFYTCLKIFGPSWIPGTTIVVLMDYNLYAKSKATGEKLDSLRAQHDFIQKFSEHFEPVPTGTTYNTVRAFRYLKALDFAALPTPLSLKERRRAERGAATPDP